MRDRTVLKIYEPGFQESIDGGVLRSSASTPVDLSYHSEPEVDQQVRQRRYHTMTMPVVNEREVDVRQRTKSEGATFSKQAPATQVNTFSNLMWHLCMKHSLQNTTYPFQKKSFSGKLPFMNVRYHMLVSSPNMNIVYRVCINWMNSILLKTDSNPVSSLTRNTESCCGGSPNVSKQIFCDETFCVYTSSITTKFITHDQVLSLYRPFVHVLYTCTCAG